MSCLLNTISANTAEYFQTHDKILLQKARQLSEMPDFAEHPVSVILADYQDCLADEGAEALRRSVVVDHGTPLGEFGARSLSPEAVDKDKTLQILEPLFILRPWFSKEEPSESDCLHLWTSVFGILMERIQIKTGETTLGASKIMRRLQRLEHGEVSETGSKVDCIFVADGVEISNTEFKKVNISGTEVAIENRKNVCPVRCIQEDL
ncbi:hypothetical protein BGZ98_002784 [Dissophora globulifera]|nr:hypothetical protein BGZ98_002784 [Dissophora globulifera]